MYFSIKKGVINSFSPCLGIFLIILCFLTIIPFSIAFSQDNTERLKPGDETNVLEPKLVWTKTFDHPGYLNIKRSIVLNNGSSVLAGETVLTGSEKKYIWLSRIDLNGDIDWEHTIDIGQQAALIDIARSDNVILVLAATYDPEKKRYIPWLAEFDFTGAKYWESKLNGLKGAMPSATVADGMGNYYLVGTSDSDEQYRRQLWAGKIDSSGKIVWQKSYGKRGEDIGHDIAKFDQNSFVVVATSHPKDEGRTQGRVLNVSENGEVVWDVPVDLGLHTSLKEVAVSEDGQLFLVGDVQLKNTSSLDALVLKMNKSGGVVWTQSVGGSNQDLGISIALDWNGDLIVGGETSTWTFGEVDFLLVKVSETGEVYWRKNFGGVQRETLKQVLAGPDGYYRIVGETGSTGKYYFNGWLARISDQAGAPSPIIPPSLSPQDDDIYSRLVRLEISESENFPLKIASQTTFKNDKTVNVSDMVQLDNGDVVLVGIEEDGRLEENSIRLVEDIWLSRISKSGNILWRRTIPSKLNESVHSIHNTPDGNLLIVAIRRFDQSRNYSHFGNDLLFVKIDREGKVLSEKVVSKNETEGVIDAISDPDGEIIVAALRGDPNNENVWQLWIAGFDSVGNQNWQRNLGEPVNHSTLVLTRLSDGAYSIISYYYEADDHGGVKTKEYKFSKSNPHPVIRVLDVRKWGSSDGFWQVGNGRRMIVDTGASRRVGDTDIMLSLLDRHDKEIWTRYFGTDRDDKISQVIPINGNRAVLVGNSSLNKVYASRAFLMLVNGDGKVEWYKEFSRAGFGEHLLKARSFDHGGFGVVMRSGDGETFEGVTWFIQLTNK